MEKVSKSLFKATAKQLANKHVSECNLSNEGEIETYVLDATGQTVRVVNDGHKCNVMLDNEFVYGIDLIEN